MERKKEIYKKCLLVRFTVLYWELTILKKGSFHFMFFLKSASQRPSSAYKLLLTNRYIENVY